MGHTRFGLGAALLAVLVCAGCAGDDGGPAAVDAGGDQHDGGSACTPYDTTEEIGCAQPCPQMVTMGGFGQETRRLCTTLCAADDDCADGYGCVTDAAGGQCLPCGEFGACE